MLSITKSSNVELQLATVAANVTQNVPSTTSEESEIEDDLSISSSNAKSTANKLKTLNTK